MKKTRPLKVSDIEYMANDFRRGLGIKPSSPFPILEVLEKLSCEGCFSIQYLEDNDPLFEENEQAKYSPIDNYIYIKESVLVELENGNYRANFTLAHEFFHYIQCKVLFFTFEEVEKCCCYEDAEWQANEFAAQILIPTRYIEKNVNSNILAEIFKVSISCVTTRKLYYQRRLNRK